MQVALDAYLAGSGATADVLGLSTERGYRAGLAELAQPSSPFGPPPDAGPAEYTPIDVGDRTISALRAGLVLVADGADRLAVLLGPRGPDEDGDGLTVQVMAVARETAEAWLQRLRELMRVHNVYRGKVVGFGGGDDPWESPPLTVRHLPAVSRERIVVSGDALERIERHTAGIARHRDALRAGGRHIKRGVLLQGPPGTGKTLTVMYLAGLMPGRTVIVLTGEALGATGTSCWCATRATRRAWPR